MLYVVATPIGNLEDISLRALRILREADVIFAEDTRHTRHLLTHFDIHTPLRSCHEHNERQSTESILALLREGKQIALVSDAGLPGISDPGGLIIQQVAEERLPHTVIPGANAALTALLLSGLPTDHFCFEGFLPRDKRERKKRLAALQNETRTLLFYESPLRVADTLDELHRTWGERPAALCRELTKIHETVLRGSLSELCNRIDSPLKGECVLVIGGAEPAPIETADPEELLSAMHVLIETDGLRAKDAAKQLAGDGISANALYRMYLNQKSPQQR